MLPVLTIALKIALTAGLVVASTLIAERMRPTWGGIVATIPFSSGAAHVMLAMSETDAFVSYAALGSLVTSIAAFIYLVVFVLMAPRHGAFYSAIMAFLAWLLVSLVCLNLQWSVFGAAAFNIIAFVITFRLTQAHRAHRGQSLKVRPTHREILWRGLAAGLLATLVSVTAQMAGPAIAGMLAVFPVVYLSVSFIVHRRMGGVVAAATMASAVLPLLGVALTFMTLSMLAPEIGRWPALLCAFSICVSWPLAVTIYHLHVERKGTA